MSRLSLPLTLSALSLILLLSFSIALMAGPSARAGHSDSTIDLIAIDAVPAGNTATSLGTIDSCARTEVGSDITIDLVVDSIPDDRSMVAFEIRILYDPQIVEVVAADSDQLLAASGSYQPFAGLSDSLPDSDGNLSVSVLDVASNSPPGANMESGPGIISRITLRAKAPGATDLTIGFDLAIGVYPLIIDNNGEVIQVDRLGAAAVAVGEDCAPAPAQPPTTTLPGFDELGILAPTTSSLPSPTPPEDDTTIPPSAGPGTPSLATPSVQATATAVAAAAAGTDPDDSDPDTTDPDGADPDGTDPDSTDPSSEPDNGAPITLIVILALVGIAIAGGGSWLLYRWRQGRA